VIATDFLHVDTVLLKRLYVLMFIEHGARRIHIAGISANPGGAWTSQQARNLAMAMGERLEQMRFLIRDRGGQFTTSADSARPHQGICDRRSAGRLEVQLGQGRVVDEFEWVDELILVE
jgi:putative transposase